MVNFFIFVWNGMACIYTVARVLYTDFNVIGFMSKLLPTETKSSEIPF